MECLGIEYVALKRFLPELVPKIKHGDEGIVIWRSMCIHRCGLICKVKKRMNRHYYCKILKQNVCRKIQKFLLDLFCIIFNKMVLLYNYTYNKASSRIFFKAMFHFLTLPNSIP